MLTTEAFNALLKILEEPPPHVVFILATTELDKIPATITSRAQVIRFSKASPAELLVALKNIVNTEKLESDDSVLEEIAQRADGSFRDAVKLLEMIAQVGPVTRASAQNILSLSLSNQVVGLVDTLLTKDPVGVVQAFSELRAVQTDSKQLHVQLLTYLHQDLLRSLGAIEGKATVPTKSSQFLLKELADPTLCAAAPIPLLLLELKFLEIIDRSQKKAPASGSSEPSAPPPTRRPATPEPTREVPSRRIAQPDTIPTTPLIEEEFSEEIAPYIPEKPQLDVVPTSGGTMGNGQTICDRWQDVIAEAVKSNFSLATLLKASRPLGGETGKVKISVYYQFHKEQLMQPRFIKLLDTLFQDFAGGKVQLECILIKEPVTAELSQPTEAKKLADLAVSSLM
jgi:DNA polymerase-3 subunit gamma/tau